MKKVILASMLLCTQCGDERSRPQAPTADSQFSHSADAEQSQDPTQSAEESILQWTLKNIFRSQAPESSSPQPTVETKPKLPAHSPGAAVYTAQCAACHGQDAEGGSTGISMYTCPTCTSAKQFIQTVATTMPPRDPTSCDRGCAEKVFAYLTELKQQPALDQDSGKGLMIEKVAKLSPLKLLEKITLRMVARTPTPQEYQAVTTHGYNALEPIVDTLFQDQAFCYEKMRQIYIPRVSTNFFHEQTNKRIAGYTRGSQPFNTLNTRSELYHHLVETPLSYVTHITCADLPFSQVLLADKILVNKVTAAYFPKASGMTFSNDLRQYKFVPNAVDEPVAGMLTAKSFLAKFPTSKTNVNRAIANAVLTLFLDTDVQEFNQSANTLNEEDLTNFQYPEVENPACATCHRMLDPIAHLYSPYSHPGGYRQYDPNNRRSSIFNPGRFPFMFPAGYFHERIPENQKRNALPWLARKIVADERFALAITKHMFDGLSGNRLVFKEAETYRSIASQQRRFLQAKAQQFKQEGYSLRQLVKALTLHNPWFTANFSEQTCPTATCFVTDSTRPLSSDEIDLRLRQVFASSWYLSSGASPTEKSRFTKIFGPLTGMPNLETMHVYPQKVAIVPIRSVIDVALANEVACQALVDDSRRATNQKKYLQHANLNQRFTAQPEAIKKDFAQILSKLWGKTRFSTQEVDDIYMFVQAQLQTPSTGKRCRQNGSFSHAAELHRGYLQLMVYALMDSRFNFLL